MRSRITAGLIHRRCIEHQLLLDIISRGADTCVKGENHQSQHDADVTQGHRRYIISWLFYRDRMLDHPFLVHPN